MCNLVKMVISCDIKASGECIYITWAIVTKTRQIVMDEDSCRIWIMAVF